jgi:cyclopropane-fatty-acyl-phospholipid synthase
MWQFYLAGAEAAFRYGGMVNWQLQYMKRRDAVPMTRDYMFEEEARLRALDGEYREEYSPGVQLAAE